MADFWGGVKDTLKYVGCLIVFLFFIPPITIGFIWWVNVVSTFFKGLG